MDTKNESLIHQRQTIKEKQTGPRTIAMVTDDFLPAKTGVGIHVQNIAPELVRRGHTVLILTSRRPGQPAEETWNGVKIYRFFSLSVLGFYQALPATADINNIFRENHVNVVHFPYLSFLMYRAHRAAKSLGLRTV